MPMGVYKRKNNKKQIEAIRRIGKNNMGKKHTKEFKEMISKRMKGNIPWNKGMKGINNYHVKGENHYAWKGGITTENDKIRKSDKYKFWRKAIFGRDNFTCQKCNCHGGILNVHHINNFADFPELRMDINNGIVLCEKCHKKFHKLFGKKNNTKEQLIEFLYEK